MKYFLLLAVLFSFRAQSQTPLQVINGSVEKIKNLKTLSYSIYVENSQEKVNADVSLKRGPASPVFETATFKVQGIAMSDAGSDQLSFAYDGTSFTFLHPRTKEYTRLDSPSYSKLSRTNLTNYFGLIPAPYWQQQPFEALLKQAKNMEKLKDTTIYGVGCHAIKITIEFNMPAAGTQLAESMWYIGKKDSLIYGRHSKTEKLFLKIHSVDKAMGSGAFSLVTVPKVMTGLEPLGEGLLAPGTKAPSWVLSSSKGKISLDSLRGKVVLIDFWGTWCAPCIKAMPHIQAIYNTFKNEQVEVLGISVETDRGKDPIGFSREKGYTYPIVLDGHTIVKDYQVQIFPSIYLIDQNGIIIHAEYGGSRENFQADMIDRIRKALKQKG